MRKVHINKATGRMMTGITYAEPEVELVGKTVFMPPIRGEENRYLLEPGAMNLLGEFESDGEAYYDASALAEFAGRNCYQAWERKNPATATNAGYLRNILTQSHFSVLEHGQVSFFISGISRALSHELVRHRHFSFSQLSQRYVKPEDLKFVLPPDIAELEDGDVKDQLVRSFEYACATAVQEYNETHSILVKAGWDRKKALQAARAVLPNATETIIVFSGNYRSLIEFLIKRTSPAADSEIRNMAYMILEWMEVEAPNLFGVDARTAWTDEIAQKEARA